MDSGLQFIPHLKFPLAEVFVAISKLDLQFNLMLQSLSFTELNPITMVYAVDQ